MRASKLLLYTMLLHSPQWDFASKIVCGVPIDNMQVVSDIESTPIEANMTVGAQT